MAVSKQVPPTISPPAASLTASRRAAKARAQAAFARYQRAFADFNEEELMILDGIIPEHRS